MKRMFFLILRSAVLAVSFLAPIYGQVHHAQLGNGYQIEDPYQDAAQQKKITVHIVNSSLENALQQIAKKSSIGIYYNPQLLPAKIINANSLM